MLALGTIVPGFAPLNAGLRPGYDRATTVERNAGRRNRLAARDRSVAPTRSPALSRRRNPGGCGDGHRFAKPLPSNRSSRINAAPCDTSRLSAPGMLSQVARRSVLDRDGANVPFGINVEQGVLVEIARLCHRRIAELDEKGAGTCKVANSHGSYRRSKKALWTVSPSESRRRPLASIERPDARARPPWSRE